MVKDFNRLFVRFRQFGGWRLMWQYVRMGVLWLGIKELMRCILRGHSIKSVYPFITQKVDALLLERYKNVLEEGLLKYNVANGKEPKNKKPKVLWSGWLQGENSAPELVKACWNSWRQHLPGYELRIITMDNYTWWIELPEWFVEKYRRGIIPPALFSDVMRIELLVRHGGTWIDGTVLCTGFPTERLQKQWTDIETSPFCVFRYFKKGQREAVGLSNWFISANAGDAMLAALRDALYCYWKDYNCTVDYYICHLFLDVLLHGQPYVVAAMPRCNSTHSTLLGRKLACDFNEEAWQELTEHVAFHKFNFRKTKEAKANPQSYCNFILKQPFNSPNSA